jgi:uncharacterized sulfatase
MTPETGVLENNTFVTFGDLDASPSKAFLVNHRFDPKYKSFYDYAFGRRPAEELYRLSDDPDQLHNVAADPEFGKAKSRLRKQLLGELERQGDPRVLGDGSTFDKPPYAGG